jgi:uncharacterized membrane protein
MFISYLCSLIDTGMAEYIFKAFSVWFIGFFPWAEIYVAVPAGIGLGLDIYSVIVWSVFGNFVPAVIITRSFDTLVRYPRVARIFEKFASPRARSRIERHGVKATLILTPWLGVWAMAATVKIFGMQSGPFLRASFVSILVYAVVLAVLIRIGVDFFS